MAQKTLENEPLLEALDIERKIDQGIYSNITQAAKEIGMPRSTLVHRIELARIALDDGVIESQSKIELPTFPDSDIDTDEIIDHMEQRFKKRLKHEAAKTWFSVKFPTDETIGLAVVGDPHLGTNTNWPLLKSHVSCMKETKGLYAINIGDNADNWGWGRLMALYADDDISRQTERRLGKWLLESGIQWCAWLHGNHELFHGEFPTYLEAINCKKVPMVDWRAKLKLVFPSGELKVDAAHDHKGSSIYSPLHGQKRAALWGQESCDLYVAGHRHSWALSQEELDNGHCVVLGRARGYKWNDPYSLRHGFAEQSYGASLLFVIDIKADGPMKIVPFADLLEGAEYLKWKRASDRRSTSNTR